LMQIERTERSHLSKSHFFKTSMKKLAPLARQISGKSIDEAILQMRFSKKKAAIDVRKHLIQARDEAIVIRGMGLNNASPDEAEPASATPTSDSPIITDPGITPPLAHQNPTKTTKAGVVKSETDIYVAQAWTNRGPYGAEPEFRARGRVNILRPPWTGISVLLKEEKTRTREKADKEEKSIRRRTGKNLWTQLPDRPITKQSQYVLW
jgi:ribosomal protein L22